MKKDTTEEAKHTPGNLYISEEDDSAKGGLLYYLMWTDECTHPIGSVYKERSRDRKEALLNAKRFVEAWNSCDKLKSDNARMLELLQRCKIFIGNLKAIDINGNPSDAYELYLEVKSTIISVKKEEGKA